MLIFEDIVVVVELDYSYVVEGDTFENYGPVEQMLVPSQALNNLFLFQIARSASHPLTSLEIP